MKKWLILLLMLVFGSMATATEPKVTLINDGIDPQFEITTPEGTRILIDISDPTALSKPVTAEDILLTTHSHPDHVNRSFSNSFPGRQLMIKAGILEGNGYKITGIPSLHGSIGDFMPEGGSNYIFLIETGGLRIAHFGDIGQEQLTPEQLSTLGAIDIAITQFSNSYSNMSADNLKGFQLMDQLTPKLIIPTHNDEPAARLAAKKWPAFYAAGPITLGKSDLLQPNTKLLFLETWGKIAKNLKLAKKWPSK